MQNDERNQNEAEVQRPEDHGPESRRAALGGHSCEWCEGPLTGRKERFCTDRCRMRRRRERQRTRVDELLQRLEGDLHALRAELVREVEP
jgi:predicted nucleic acid-binding Zn ribbon protein